jgi:hypothetical protein
MDTKNSALCSCPCMMTRRASRLASAASGKLEKCLEAESRNGARWGWGGVVEGGHDSHVDKLEMSVVDTRLQQLQRHGLAVEWHVPNLPQLHNARSKCCGVESGCFGKRMAHAVFLNRLQKQERLVCFAVDREEFKVLSVRLKRIAKRVGEQVSDLCGPLHHERRDGATSHEDVGHNAPVNARCGVACRWGGKTADGGWGYRGSAGFGADESNDERIHILLVWEGDAG